MRARPRDLVVLLVVALAFYAFLIGVAGISLLGDHRWAAKGLGLGVLLLPLIGIVIVVNELRFGRATERLAQLLDEPTPPAATAEPDAAFEIRKAEVEAAPEDWRAWYRLAVAYGNARDTARGRRAMRKAIALQRATDPACSTSPSST
jgi:cytochrome c-type biogenesis protein CcmH/NrfG